MNKLNLLFLCCFGFAEKTLAQEEKLKANDLFLTSSPGLVLADKAPSSIEKPTNPKTFGVSLLNLWQGGAIEATPFWFSNKPQYTYQDWIKKKVLFFETFNISAATFREEDRNILSAGFRSTIFRSYSKAAIKKLTSQEDKIIELLTPGSVGATLDEEKIKEESDKLDAMEQRGFYALEIAGAMLGSGKENDFENIVLEKSGIWMNFRLSPLNNGLDFVALFRYSWTNNANNITIPENEFYDYGLSLNYEKSAFNISGEYVFRHDNNLNEQYKRLAFSGAYQLNPNMALVASFGKNFAKEDNIIALFGINFGLVNNRIKEGDEDE